MAENRMLTDVESKKEQESLYIWEGVNNLHVA